MPHVRKEMRPRGGSTKAVPKETMDGARVAQRIISEEDSEGGIGP